MMTLWSREPAMILAVVQAALALLMGFGLKLTGDQVALVMAFLAAVLGLLTRSQVTSPTTAARTER